MYLQVGLFSTSKREYVGGKQIHFGQTSSQMSQYIYINTRFYLLPFLFLLVDYVQDLKNVVLTYRDHKSSWEGLMKRGMLRDCPWENAAIQYEQLFMEPVLLYGIRLLYYVNN